MSVFVKITLNEGRLSISGVEGPLPSGNCLGGCGQIDMSMDAEYRRGINLAPGWTRDKVKQFLDVWKRWHLNDLTAGTPEQEAFLREYSDPIKDYTETCSILRRWGLEKVYYPRGGKLGYTYGHAWLFERVPEDILDFLLALPTTDKIPAWV